MPDSFDTLAHDVVTAARVPLDHVEREMDDLTRALQSMAASSHANGLSEDEIADEARAVASVSPKALELRYAPEVVAP